MNMLELKRNKSINLIYICVMKFALCLLIPFFSYCQFFTIDDNYIEMYNSSTQGNFSQNTYLNTIDDLTISYEIIVDSLPIEWEFQNCFPTCNPIGTYSFGPISFPSDSSVYLNGHFYPNGVEGEALLVMELNANHGTQIDTVSWRAVAMSEVNLTEHVDLNSQIKLITNLNGQIVNDIRKEKVLIITYQNNQSKLFYILR